MERTRGQHKGLSISQNGNADQALATIVER
jgi:hypothetical protein